MNQLTIPMGEYGEDRLSFRVESSPDGRGLVLAITAGDRTYCLYERDWLRLRRLLDGMDTTADKPADPLEETVRRLVLADSMMHIARGDASAAGRRREVRAWDEALLWLEHAALSVNDATRARRDEGE